MRIGEQRVLFQRTTRFLFGAFAPRECVLLVRIPDAEPCARRGDSRPRERIVRIHFERSLEVLDCVSHVGFGVIHHQAAPTKIHLVRRRIGGVTYAQTIPGSRRQFDAQRRGDLFGQVVL
jgi:hypothetical protein